MNVWRLQRRVINRSRGFLLWLVSAVLLAVPGQIIAQPSFEIGNATGSPGGRAEVTVRLTGGGGEAATSQIDILFDPAIFTIDPATDCERAARLTNHILTTNLPPGPPPPDGFEGRQRLRLAILDITPPVDGFADGDLATCSLRIAASAPLGDVTLVGDPAFLQVGGTEGEVICGPGSSPAVTCAKLDGTVSIQPPTATPLPTSTNTPVPPTNTPVPPTNTPRPTATNTLPPPTNTTVPTSTRTNSPVPTSTRSGGGGGGGGGCTIASPGEVGTGQGLWLILGVGVLLRARRRWR